MHRALSLATALLAAVPATAAERGLHQPPRATTIAARGDVLAYSRWDAATGAFRLRVAVGDHVPVDVPVAPRSAPFDVHVGRATEPDGTRRTVLVYSRCAKEPPTSTALAPEQLWRGCSLRVAGLAGGELRSAAPARVSSPALSGKKLKFRALHPRKAPAHRRAPFDRAGPPRRNIRPGRGTPVDMDLRGDRLAVIRRHQGHNEVEDSALDLVDVRSGTRRRIHHRKGGGQTGHFIVGASRLPHGGVVWGEICGGDTKGCVSGTELVSRWTPRGGLHSHELQGSRHSPRHRSQAGSCRAVTRRPTRTAGRAC
jgi:hypothetical protein